MIKINGYWYSHQEVKEALEKKGYSVAYAGEWFALKDGKNTPLEIAAKLEFEKKPPLV